MKKFTVTLVMGFLLMGFSNADALTKIITINSITGAGQDRGAVTGVLFSQSQLLLRFTYAGGMCNYTVSSVQDGLKYFELARTSPGTTTINCVSSTTNSPSLTATAITINYTP